MDSSKSSEHFSVQDGMMDGKMCNIPLDSVFIIKYNCIDEATHDTRVGFSPLAINGTRDYNWWTLHLSIVGSRPSH